MGCLLAGPYILWDRSSHFCAPACSQLSGRNSTGLSLLSGEQGEVNEVREAIFKLPRALLISGIEARPASSPASLEPRPAPTPQPSAPSSSEPKGHTSQTHSTQTSVSASYTPDSRIHTDRDIGLVLSSLSWAERASVYALARAESPGPAPRRWEQTGPASSEPRPRKRWAGFAL